jgi:hypothetical protein
MYYKTTILLITYRTGDQKRGVSLKISGKQPKVRFKRVKRVKGVHVISPESLILDVAAIQAFKGLSKS